MKRWQLLPCRFLMPWLMTCQFFTLWLELWGWCLLLFRQPLLLQQLWCSELLVVKVLLLLLRLQLLYLLRLTVLSLRSLRWLQRWLYPQRLWLLLPNRLLRSRDALFPSICTNRFQWLLVFILVWVPGWRPNTTRP